MKEDNDMAAINWLVKRFAIPLQGAQANTDEIVTEFREMVSMPRNTFPSLCLRTILFGGSSFMLQILLIGQMS